MPAVIFKLLQPVAPYLAAAAVLLGVGLYIFILRHDLAAADAANTVLEQTNEANAAAITAFKTQQQNMQAALTALDTKSQANDAAVGHIDNNIVAAPATDNAPVAPVLAHALDSLRALQGANP